MISNTFVFQSKTKGSLNLSVNRTVASYVISKIKKIKIPNSLVTAKEKSVYICLSKRQFAFVYSYRWGREL